MKKGKVIIIVAVLFLIGIFHSVSNVNRGYEISSSRTLLVYVLTSRVRLDSYPQHHL